MKQTPFSIDLSNVRTKIRSFQKQGKEILYSAIFFIEGKKQKLVDMADPAQLSLVTKNLKYETPEKIRIELYDKNNSRNHIWLKEFIFQPHAIETEKPASSLGEAEISQIVDQRMAERQRLAEYEELKSLAKELNQENHELQEKIAELEAANDELQAELEQKSTIRYYAGMLGDVLVSLGMKKEKMQKTLAGLIGMDDEKPEQKQLTAEKNDSSGIVEEKPVKEDPQRTEVIDLIVQYLKSLPNVTLANVFKIFSAIEQDPSLGDEILEFLSNHNTKSNE
jgi:uncharacterized protein YukE